MKPATLCLFFRENRNNKEILLAMKKRGFGVGKWNGYGGKIEDGEPLLEAACREIKEESGLIVKPKDLEKVAEIDFRFSSKPEWDQLVHVFIVKKWRGEAAESEEMKPQWFKLDEVPYKDMWVPDQIWLRYVIEGKKLKARFNFTPDGEGIESQVINFVDIFD